MTNHMSLNLENAQALEQAGVVTFKGFSGKLTTAEIAFQAPEICQMHSNRGDVFDLIVAYDRLIATKA